MGRTWFCSAFVHLDVLFILPFAFLLAPKYKPFARGIFTAQSCKLVSVLPENVQYKNLLL